MKCAAKHSKLEKLSEFAPPVDQINCPPENHLN